MYKPTPNRYNFLPPLQLSMRFEKRALTTSLSIYALARSPDCLYIAAPRQIDIYAKPSPLYISAGPGAACNMKIRCPLRRRRLPPFPPPSRDYAISVPSHIHTRAAGVLLSGITRASAGSSDFFFPKICSTSESDQRTCHSPLIKILLWRGNLCARTGWRVCSARWRDCDYTLGLHFAFES